MEGGWRTDVRADETESKNLAQANGALVATMAARLKSYVPYVPELSPANLACYECGNTSDAPPKLWWQGFSGPCCVRKPTGAL